MKRCDYCNHILENIPFHCRYCGKQFCERHRLPENHECDYLLVEDSMEELLYSDILESLEGDLTVADIYHNFTIKKFTEEQTIGLLRHLLEQSNDNYTQMHCIQAFKSLQLIEDSVFAILEETILSNRNKKVSQLALKVVKELFPKKSKRIQNWLSKQDHH